MTIAPSKLIYNPDGEVEEHTFLNAYDLLAHAGYTISAPKSDAEDTTEDETEVVDEIEEEETDEDTAPDFAAMTKDQLEDFAKENYEVALDKRKSQATLASDVQQLYEEHAA